MRKYSVYSIDSFDKSFFNKWEKLWHESPYAHFYNSPFWFLSCLKTFDVPKYLILVFEKDNKVLGIFPLVYGKRFKVQVLKSPGEDSLEKSTLLLANIDSLLIKAIFNQVKKFGSLYLAEMNQSVIRYLSNNDFYKGMVSENPFICLNDDPFKFLSKKQRSKIFNRFKRYEKYLKFEYFSDDPLRHLTIVNDIDNRSHKRAKGLKTISDFKDKIELLINLHKQRPGSVSVSLLKYKDKPIVYAVGFVCKKTYYAIQTAYHSEYRQLSPGKLILYLLLKKLKSDGIELFDFSRGSAIIKSEFTPLASVQYDIYFSRNHFVLAWWKMNIWGLRILKGKFFYDAFCALRKNIFAVRGTLSLRIA